MPGVLDFDNAPTGEYPVTPEPAEPTPGPEESSWRLESPFRSPYRAWKATPGPAANGAMLRALRPVIDTAVRTYAGPQASPTLHGRARQMTLEALPRYDPSRTKLKTYLLNHLQGLRRLSVRENNIISVPEQVQMDLFHLNRRRDELAEELGRDPSDLELADRTGLSVKRIAYVRTLRLPTSESAMLQPFRGSDSSDYNEPAVRGGGEADASAWQRFVHAGLDPVDQVILEHSFGLYGKPVLSNRDIARRLNITPSAVSQRRVRIQGLLDQRSRLGVL